MKKSIFILSLLALSQASFAAKKQKQKATPAKGISTTINGVADGYDSGYIIFSKLVDQSKQDTVKVVKGTFQYNTKLEEAEALVYKRHDNQSNIIFVHPGVCNMIIDYKGNKGFGITNSPAQESYQVFLNQINPFIQKRTELAQMHIGASNPDSIGILRNTNEISIQQTFDSYLKNPNSHPSVTSFLAMSNIQGAQGVSPDMLNTMYNALTPAAKNTMYGQMANKYLGRLTADDMGKIAPDFSLLDSNDKKVTLSQFRNKNYVLVDFWATWCGPCRAEFPALYKAQEKYKSKGLVILGVSIDADKEKWKTFLSKPGVSNWMHVWDGPQGPNQIVNTLYNVPGIPRNFLLDKEGRVIAKNLRGADVERTLEQFIK